MAKTFEITAGAKKAIDKAMARLDARKARQRKAATAKRIELKRRRERERADATRTTFNVEAMNRRPNELRKRYAVAGWRVLVARMEDGTWYDWPQIRELMTEFEKGSLKAWLWQKAMKAGLIERAGNDAFRPDINNPAEQGPRYLYRLTGKGASEAASARIALGMSD